MSLSILSRIFFLAAISLGCAQLASAQAMIKVSDPKFDTLPSPDVNIGGKSKNFRQKDWLEIEVQLSVDKVAPQPEDGFVDSLELKWYVVVKGQDRKNYLIEKTVTHVNIPIGEEVIASVYISPNTMRRITGSESYGRSDIEAVGGEVHFNGEMANKGFFSHGAKAGWWKKQRDSVTSTTKFPLLNKDETPFKLFWYDRYAEIAKKN